MKNSRGCAVLVIWDPAAWFFFCCYIWYSTVIQYCIVYTLLYIQYCKKFPLHSQNKLKIRAPPAPSIPVIIKSLRWGAREFLIFFSYYIWYSTSIQYCILYNRLYSDHKTNLRYWIFVVRSNFPRKTWIFQEHMLR